MKIPASHVKMGAQLAEQFPAFQAEFSIYGSFEKTYNKTLRLRDFIQLVATSFGVPILAAKQTAEAVFDSRIHETITPNVPIILSAPFTYCIKCQSHLKIGRWQEVTILDADSAKSGLLYKSSCVNLSCSIQLYDVDSVSEITEGNSTIEHYPMNTIRKQKVIGINSKYYMTVAFANLWLKNVPSVMLLFLRYAEQYSGIPSAASSSIFKRAYYLYQMLLLQEYIQDPAVSEALQAAHEDFDYSCFQPSWGEKGRRLFPYSLHLGEYSSNQVSDNVEDLRLAMKEYVEWMNAHFADERERENSFDYQPLSCKEAEHMEAVRKFFSDPSTTSEKTAKKYGGKTRVSVGHVKDDERNYEEFGFCYSPFDRFLPGVFLVVWSCGHIMDIGKMYSYESNKFFTGFLCQTFMRLDEYPTFMFYDKACVFVRTLKNGAQQNKLLHKTPIVQLSRSRTTQGYVRIPLLDVYGGRDDSGTFHY
ncbi:hypothetical protein BDR26DRAFT_1003484 [Obelidium mucronatum]|nr:hypothetical protein BDR26DRAFT_1003484 [Obelidium mucronatum]